MQIPLPPLLTASAPVPCLTLLSGERYVSFDGIAQACAKAMGAPEPELVHYNPKDFDFGKDKAFPLRDQHFFTSIDKVRVGRGFGQHDLMVLSVRILPVGLPVGR